MMRWAGILLLLAAVVCSAVGVVTLRHESRQLFIALEAAAEERDAARTEWSRLQLEQAWLAEAGRIERQAIDDLDMRSPESSRVLVRQP